MNLSRRALLTGFTGLAAGAVTGKAEAKPPPGRGPKPRPSAHVKTFSDGVGMREYSIIVGPPPTGISAPLVAFTLGTEVGVPTGTSLTPTTGLPAADASESFHLVHPVSGATTDRTVSVWRRRRWTQLINPAPGSGVTYLFDECEFDCAADFFCVDTDNAVTTNNLMAPSFIFRRCSFDGNNGSVDKCFLGSHAWFLGCDLRGGEDGIAGNGSYVIIQDSNVQGYSDDIEQHSDGFQCSELGNVTIYHSFISNGDGPGESSSIFFKPESATPMSNIQIYYTGIHEGVWGLHLDGSNAAISSVDVQHCRWQNNPDWAGPVTYTNVSSSTWVDNTFVDGTPISAP